MQNDKKKFTYLSLQDAKSIKPILNAINKGLTQDEMVFKNSDGEIVLTPEGLLRLKISASKTSTRHKLDIKISWDVDEQSIDDSDSLSISSTNKK